MSDRLPVDIAALLSAAEDAPPAHAVAAAGEQLARALGTGPVSFLIADAAGGSLVDHLDASVSVAMDDSPEGRAWRSQEVVLDGDRACVPVTVRGDALGVLGVVLPARDGEPAGSLGAGVARELAAVAHALGYVLIANQRHTDVYETAMRSTHFTLAREIQRRLLPPGFVCEGGSFTLAGWLEPSASAGGDTFDYVASEHTLTATLTDAVGHDLNSAMVATLAVGALRNARRGDASLADQALHAHEAIAAHAGPGEFVTGILLEADLQPDARPGAGGATRVRFINAGHPGGLLLRAGAVTRVAEANGPALGIGPGLYEPHELELLPGDRLLLMTDGMFEHSASSFDLSGMLAQTADRHPRNVAQDISRAFLEVIGDSVKDDAALLLLEWHGGSTRRQAHAGADVG